MFVRNLIQMNAISALCVLSACGETPPKAASEAAAPEAAPSVAEIAEKAPQAQVTEEGPQLGDKIGEEAGAGLADAAAEALAAEREVEARGARVLTWEELMPEGEEERLAEMYQMQMAQMYSGPGGGIEEGSAADKGVQIGTFNVVKELDGQTVRLPGYSVPFSFAAKAEVSEFLLVPYFGACLHNPPPPPNQTVYIKLDKPMPLKDIAQAVWIEGVITTKRQNSDLADTAYTINATLVEDYEY